MAILRRILVWGLEIACEALLSACLMLFCFIPSEERQPPFNSVKAGDVFLIATMVAFMFLITGYLLTTILFRVLWRRPKLWHYPAVAVVLFSVHFEMLSRGVGGAFDPSDRMKFRVVGAGFVLACTFVGSYVLRKWEQTEIERGKFKDIEAQS